ncbi:MAG: hypothetical protein HQL02_04140 [Nitrospirae bacterium]|nr:hypothetical protein [Nitrospirota bacterium]
MVSGRHQKRLPLTSNTPLVRSVLTCDCKERIELYIDCKHVPGSGQGRKGAAAPATKGAAAPAIKGAGTAVPAPSDKRRFLDG